MPIPTPFEFETFIENIEEARSRSIHLMPIPDLLIGLIGVCGLWIKHQRLPLESSFTRGARSASTDDRSSCTSSSISPSVTPTSSPTAR